MDLRCAPWPRRWIDLKYAWGMYCVHTCVYEREREKERETETETETEKRKKEKTSKKTTPKGQKGRRVKSYLNSGNLGLCYLLGDAFWGLNMSDTLMAMMEMYAVWEFLGSDGLASTHVKPHMRTQNNDKSIQEIRDETKL